jgi:hypothetical protein
MGTAYTPGLTVTGRARIRKTRRLPLKGEVVVEVGDKVSPSTVVARAMLPGELRTVKVSQMLGIEPSDLPRAMLVKIGDRIERDQVIAQVSSFFGLFKSVCRSPVSGTVEYISEVSGHVGIREPSIPLTLNAYIRGEVVEIIPEEGVVVETKGAFIQGIFGVGGESHGTLCVVASSPDAPLSAEDIGDELSGKILVGGSIVTSSALRRAAEVGVKGVITGGITDRDLVEFVGREIGVAITGHEDLPFPLMITEGFGRMRMAERTFSLLKSLDGMEASMNGATQIRAGVIRPEVIVPMEGIEEDLVEMEPAEEGELSIGTMVRIIREPYFGKTGTVVGLPPENRRIETGAMVRVAEVVLEDGTRVVVPRANLEIMLGRSFPLSGSSRHNKDKGYRG